jgi:hypothetical protein
MRRVIQKKRYYDGRQRSDRGFGVLSRDRSLPAVTCAVRSMTAITNGPSRFMFWALAPLLIAFLMLPAIVPPPTRTAAIVAAGIELLAILVLLGLFDSRRFWWAWRGVGALVFLLFAAYLTDMLIESGGRVEAPARRSEASAFNAICGLIAFGLPGLWYAVFGRLTVRQDSDDDVFEIEDEDDEE